MCFPSWRLHCGFCLPWSSRLEPVRSLPVSPSQSAFARLGLVPLDASGYFSQRNVQASRRSVAARAIHALPAESAAARYGREQGFGTGASAREAGSKLCAGARARVRQSFSFAPTPAIAHRARSLFRCVSQARPKWPGHTIDGGSEVVVFNRTEFRTSAPRTSCQG